MIYSRCDNIDIFFDFSILLERLRISCHSILIDFSKRGRLKFFRSSNINDYFSSQELAENNIHKRTFFNTYDQSLIIISDAFSPIIIVGALVLPPINVGIIDASTTRKPSILCNFRLLSTTAISSLPILHVPTG